MRILASSAIRATLGFGASVVTQGPVASAASPDGQRFASNAARLLLGVSVPAFALFAGTAYSQNAGAPPTPDQQGASPVLEEIVVTAQFREQNLQDTPLAITAVTGGMLEARSQTSLVDVAAQAPSLTLRSQGPLAGPAVTATIRGLGQTDASPALEPGVGIYIDDVYYPRLTGANFDLLDVDRVEILRGPQGTLTGRNSEGGAIKFFSRRPDGEGGGYVSATYGSRNRMALRGSSDFTIAEDLYARVSGAFADQDGYVNQIDYGCANPGSGIASTRAAGDCTISKWGDVAYRAVKGIVRWNPSDSLDAMISADYVHDERNPPAEVLLYADNANPDVAAAPGIPLDDRFRCGKYCNYATNGQVAAGPYVASSIGNGIDYTGGGVSANIVIGISDRMQLTSITGYREWDSIHTNDVDLSPARASTNRNATDSRFWSQELRLNTQVTDWVDLTVGGYYSDESTGYQQQQDQRSAGFQFSAKDDMEVTSQAAFSTLIVKPSDSLTLTGGVRYTEESKDFTFGRYTFDGTAVHPFLDPFGTLTGLTTTAEGDRWDYRVSADYRFSPALLTYATVSTGFKGGGVNSRPFIASQAQPFGPEELTAYEIGIKSDLFDRMLRLNVSAYFNQFTDAQITLSSCPQFNPPGVPFFPCALPANGGDADIMGIEAEIFFRPIAGLQIDASGSLLDWEWKCVNPLAVGLPAGSACSDDAAAVDRLSSPPPGVAEVQASLGVQYEIGLGNAGSLTPRIDVSHQGEIHNLAREPAEGSPSAEFGSVDSYTLANARVTWRNGNEDLDVSLEVTNLTDKYYYSSKFDGVPFFFGHINGTVGRPREWAVTAKKKF